MHEHKLFAAGALEQAFVDHLHEIHFGLREASAAEMAFDIGNRSYVIVGLNIS